MAAANERRLTPADLGLLDLSAADPRIVWAESARASSEWSSDYAASTACGPPDVFPQGGDLKGTWLASSEDRSPWIELTFAAVAQAHALLICETCGAGGIRQVSDRDQKTVLFEKAGRTTSLGDDARLLVIPLDPSLPSPRRVRIDLKKGDDYQEIDAVALITVPFETLLSDRPPAPRSSHRRYAAGEVPVHDLRGDRRLVWASRAKASSEYSSSYAARAATGAPHVFPAGGDHAGTWLSNSDDRNAWLELSFPEVDLCHGFVALETCGAGAIVRATDEAGRVLFQSARAQVPEREAHLLHVALEPGPPPKKLRLYVSGAVTDYREIDAVALLAAPFEELSTEAPPPPPPPIPGAPEGGFTFLEGTLLGASPDRPLVHATLRTKDHARAACVCGPLRVRLESGAEVSLELGETTVYGAPLRRRRGRYAALTAQVPWLAASFAELAPSPDAEALIEGRQITSERRVYLAGVAMGTSDGGFREGAGVLEKMDVAVIADVPLSATPFLRDGTKTFRSSVEKLSVERERPHPLAGWTRGALITAGLSALLAITTLVLSESRLVVGGLAMLVAFTLGTGLCANVFALELVGRMHTVTVIERGKKVGRNGRVRFSSVGWTLMGVVLLVGLPVFFWSMAMLSVIEGDGMQVLLRGVLVIAGAYALVRTTLWQWSAAHALLASLRVLMAPAISLPISPRRGRVTGALTSAVSTRETFTAHSEYLGTEQHTDAQGKVTTHDRYRTWNAREASLSGAPNIALEDGTLVEAKRIERVIDVAVLPAATKDPVYAVFEGKHEAGDVASLVGELRTEGETAIVSNATVLLGEREVLLRRTLVHLFALASLTTIALAGIAAVVHLALSAE